MKIQTPQKHSSILGYIVLFAFVATLIYIFINPNPQAPENVSLDTFISDIDSGIVEEIRVEDNKIYYTATGGAEFYTVKEPSETLTELMVGIPAEKTENIKVEIIDTTGSNFWMEIIISIVPFILIVGFLMFMMRQAANANNQAMSFGKSQARISDPEKKKKTTFKDVAGAKEAKEELIEIVDFLKNPSKYTQMGAKIPRGVILVGAPGTGKTLLARAVAGEAGVPFFNISGSEFVEMFVGVGASRVRDLFKKAKRNAPCIIFIDEIDAVGRHRGAGMGGGHDEREQTLNQILTEMDGFEQDTNVIVMAATNRPDVLDPALLRPGRFDRRIVIDIPDMDDREAILKIHTTRKPLAKGIDLTKISRQTPGFSGADLENLTNEAAILAARHDQKEVTQSDLEKSIEKVLMGPERKSHVLNKKEKEMIAYHETGHAIVGHTLPECDPVHKISIISRGMALGVTWFMPEEDKHLYSKTKFEHELASLLGGYATEKMVFGEVSTGPSNDLERATKMARKMVTKYGMSDLGPVIFGEGKDEIFLGKDFGHVRNYSEEIASKIDQAVEKIVRQALDTAAEIVKKHRKEMDRIVNELLKKESLTREEFIELFEGKKVVKKSPPSSSSSSSSLAN
ncbi:MAG: ATP-dependent zinc metalloprotease FtsH [Candidatus Gracilibacteria bacterium]|jgi:cell division protease FtsH